jgi:hypothetical protein
MIKCKDKGIWTCIGRSGKPKRQFDTSDSAIHAAKIINLKDSKKDTKLVAYKCTNCHKYHLLTVLKRIR